MDNIIAHIRRILVSSGYWEWLHPAEDTLAGASRPRLLDGEGQQLASRKAKIARKFCHLERFQEGMMDPRAISVQ